MGNNFCSDENSNSNSNSNSNNKYVDNDKNKFNMILRESKEYLETDLIIDIVKNIMNKNENENENENKNEEVISFIKIFNEQNNKKFLNIFIIESNDIKIFTFKKNFESKIDLKFMYLENLNYNMTHEEKIKYSRYIYEQYLFVNKPDMEIYL